MSILEKTDLCQQHHIRQESAFLKVLFADVITPRVQLTWFHP